MRWIDTSKKFLGALVSKDMMSIQPMLNDKVKLTSWSCDVSGKHETMFCLRIQHATSMGYIEKRSFKIVRRRFC